MNPLTYLFIAAVGFVCWLLCEIAERKSRKWYDDRNLLRLSGACLLVGLVSLSLFINELVEWVLS